MIKVRKGTFETNSSSTHSITMCTSSDYDKWRDGELYWSRWGETFLTKEVVKQQMEDAKARGEYSCESEEEFAEEFLTGEGYYTFEKYCEEVEDEYETFYESILTDSGERIIAFGYYGYDG